MNSIHHVWTSSSSLFPFFFLFIRSSFHNSPTQLWLLRFFCHYQMFAEFFRLHLRPSDSGACSHGDASGPGEAGGDDLQGAASPPLPCAAIRVAALQPATPRWSLWRPKRRDGVHHPLLESRWLGRVHLQRHQRGWSRQMHVPGHR